MTNCSQVATRSLAAEKHFRAAAPAAGRRYAERSGSDETSGRDRKEGGKRHRATSDPDFGRNRPAGERIRAGATPTRQSCDAAWLRARPSTRIHCFRVFAIKREFAPSWRRPVAHASLQAFAAMMLDPGAFNRARGCFTAELAALRNDACMLRLPPPTLRPPTPAQYGAARTLAQRRRGRGGPTMGCAVPSACVVAAPRKVNPLADVRTHDQAESARLPRVSLNPPEP